MMQILDATIIDKIIRDLNFSDLENENISDKELQTYLKYIHLFKFIETTSNEINIEFTMEDLLYSQYYWFIKYKNRYFELYERDEGLEQEAFKMLEDIDLQMQTGIDWSIIESIDKNELDL